MSVVERVVVKMVMPNVALCSCCKQNVPILRGASRKLVRHEAPCGALCVGDQIGKPGVISEHDAPRVDPLAPYNHPGAGMQVPHVPSVCPHCEKGEKATACPECGQSVGRYGEKLEDRIPHLAPCGRICHGSPHWSTGGVHEVHRALECDDCARGVKHPQMAATPQPQPAPATAATEHTTGKDETTMVDTKTDTKPAAPEQPKTKFQKTKAVLGNTAVNAAWRATTKQGLKAAQTLVVNLVKRNVKDKSIRAELARFLNSKAGEAVLAAALSAALSPMAQFDNDGDPINGAARISSELLTHVGEVGMTAVMEMFTGPLREGVGQILSGDIVVKLLNAPANEMPGIDFGAAVKEAVPVPAAATTSKAS